MSFNFSTWAIRKPIPSLMLFVLLTILGLLSFKALPVQDFPDIDLPTVTVSVGLSGATPSQLETEVTRKVEDAVATLDKVDKVTSNILEGQSVTTVSFLLEKNSQVALDETRDAVSRIRSQLPSDVTEPQVTKLNMTGKLLTYAVYADKMSPEALSWFVDNTVARRLLGVKDVGNVTRQGGASREVQVQMDLAQLKALGLTAAQVSQQLKLTQQDASGGTVEMGGVSQAVRTQATVADVNELRRMVLPLGDGRMVRLQDVATVSDTVATKSQTAFVGDQEVVSFQVLRSSGASDVSVAQAVRAEVAKLAAENASVRFEEVATIADRANDNFKDSMSALYDGALLAVLVVFLFLRDWRATLISAVALPLSVIPTFFVLHYFFEFTLNTLTLLALTLVVGILVDDAIVEVENIVRHLRMGKSPVQAATEAAQEIGLAVVATTLTLVAVFLPTAFMGGIPGKFFKQFGWTASIAVLASLLVARLLTPMMAAYFLKSHPAQEKAPGTFMRGYLRAVRWALARPGKSLIAAAVFFAGSLWVAGKLPTEFMAAGDNGQITVNVELAPGARFDDTALVVSQARKALDGLPEMVRVYSAIGSGVSGGGPRGGSATGDVRKATMTLTLTGRTERAATQPDIEKLVRERLAAVPGARFSLGTGGSGEKYAVTLAGDDAQTLTQAAQQVENVFRSVPGLGNVSSTASLLRPELVVTPKSDQAANAGVTAQSIGQALRVATSGDFDVALSKLNLPERQVPIRVWAGDPLRQDLDALRQLRIPSKQGTVALEQVSDLRLSSGPAQVTRQDRRRNVTVSVELQGQRLGEVAGKVSAMPEFKQLPAGVSVVPSGDLERMKELFGSFGLAMAGGVLCVYVVLVLLFHSFGQPLTIMAALPLSAGGAFGLLYLCGFSMSMPVLIGLLMLMGVVTKNSILLVEYAIVAQHEHGMSRTAAIIDACAKRAQPIVMTTVAMGAGMLPIALGFNGDPAFRAPMATAVIGGLLTSTFLSLLLVPVVYELVDEAKVRVSRLFSASAPLAHPQRD